MTTAHWVLAALLAAGILGAYGSLGRQVSGTPEQVGARSAGIGGSGAALAVCAIAVVVVFALGTAPHR